MSRFVFSMLLGLTAVSASAQKLDRGYLVSLDGTKLHFRVRGSDPKNPYLVILSGGPGYATTMFYAWGRTLEPFVNVVYLDQRGTGQSPRLKFKIPDKPTAQEARSYSTGTLIRDLEAVRNYLKLRKWYVLGHDWGAMLGVEYVVAHPEAVKGLIDIDGTLSEPQTEEAILNFAESKMTAESVSSNLKTSTQAKQLLLTIGAAKGSADPGQRLLACTQLTLMMFDSLCFADPKREAGYSMALRYAVQAYKIPITALGVAPEPMLALMSTDHLATRNVTKLLPQMKTPALVINGAQDHVVTASVARSNSAKIRGAKFALIVNAGHFPFVEQPAACSAAVKAFLTKH